MDCYYCKAKSFCMAACEQGSILCMMNRMRAGGTKEDLSPPEMTIRKFCSRCGNPIKREGDFL